MLQMLRMNTQTHIQNNQYMTIHVHGSYSKICFNKFLLSSLTQAKKAKQAEIERKRAEVRKRMEEAAKAKKVKKGFMTPERKKKLRVCFKWNLN